MDDMNPTTGGNPATAERTVYNRYGGRLGTAWKKYKAGTLIAAGESAPADAKAECLALGDHARVEGVIRVPGSVTALTVHFGRWVQGEKFGGANTELDGWLEMGTIDFTGLTDGQLIHVPAWETFGDLVGMYVTDLTGAVDAEKAFRYWLRGAGPA